MVVDVYNGIYAVPGKCGSRYWSKTERYNKWQIPTLYRVDFYHDIFKENLKIEYIIIRNPLSHFQSAIQTEVMIEFDNVDEIYIILNRFRDSLTGGTHFHPEFCKLIYTMWHRSDFKLEVIDLSNLTNFLKTIGFNIRYRPEEFDFKNEHNYKSKEETWNRCMELFPNIMKEILSYVESDTYYYNALLNKDRSLI